MTPKSKKNVTQKERELRYFNRELSWLQFNRRVLEEAIRTDNPLLERLRFLAIFESNLDEFYMVRLSGLMEQAEAGINTLTPDGMTPTEQIVAISQTARPMREKMGILWESTLKPELARNNIFIKSHAELSPDQKRALREYFFKELFPLCTPLLLHPAPTVPFISNRSLNLVVEIDDPAGLRLARVKIPDSGHRLIKVSRRRHEYILVEDLLIHHIQEFFPGVAIKGAHAFRVMRDADIEIRELEAADLVSNVEETIRRRRFGDPVMLELDASAPTPVRKQLQTLLELDPGDTTLVEGLLGFEVMHEIANIDRPQLKFPRHSPYQSERLAEPETLLKTIHAQDVLVHHPFDSFRSVQTFADCPNTDPQTVGIKQTLYRVGQKSPIVESLMKAAEMGKQVAVMVELKARFDESNNLVWARALERAGAHVSYGFAELKTHSKLCLLVRREPTGIQLYAHVGTGNYNPSTSRLYTDLGLFTCDPEITEDILHLFNFLTGYAKQQEYKKLLVAPLNLREGIIARINREIEHKKKGRKAGVTFKLNSLVDPEVIDALYLASSAGVPIELIVRGICCLRPGVKGMSENITVRSIVGRFLEHSRCYYFENGGQPDALLGSADLMRRNLDRRVEVLVPINEPRLVEQLWTDTLAPYLKDNTNTWILDGEGKYHRPVSKDAKRFSAQEVLQKLPLTRSL